MKVVKVFNNNVVLVLDDEGNEEIVMGHGIGFQKKPNDILDESLIDKHFRQSDNSFQQALSELYSNLSPQEVELLVKTIDKAEKHLNSGGLAENLYITLADHVHYMIERAKDGISLKNPLFWEVKKFYPTEYRLGYEVVQDINQTFGVSISEDEAASIALHFVNAQKNGQQLGETIRITRLMQELLKIVRRFYARDFDEDSISYARFVTHLQYFSQRVIYQHHQDDGDNFLYEQVKLNYPKAFECATLIRQYVESEYEFRTSEDELVYLTIHIHRSTSES